MKFDNTTWSLMQTLYTVLRDQGRIADYLERTDSDGEPRKWEDLPASYCATYPLKVIPDIMARGSWFFRETSRYPMHPAIKLAVDNTRPLDWHALVLEFPHISESDRGRVAYTRSQEHGKADRQTVTSLGKYLSRHFPTMSQTALRDIVMRFGADAFEIRRDTEGMVAAVQDGPKSCMQWEDDELDDDYMNHPYAVYDPQLGWGMAVRKEGVHICGRCLVNDLDHTFVRSYKRSDNGYSHSDEALEVWLRDQGYSKADGWHGHKLRVLYGHNLRSDFLSPYLDGEPKQVERSGEYLVVVNHGTHTLNGTNGEAEETELCSCECCGTDDDPDDMTYVEDVGSVCQSCVDNEYCYAVGRCGDCAYVHQDEAVWVKSSDQWYDRNFLDRNSIVELDNGDYEHRDKAVYLDGRAVYVGHDDACIVYCEHSGEYEHIDDCVELHDGDWALESDCVLCAVTDEWYVEGDDALVDVGDVAMQETVTVCKDGIEQDYYATYETETKEA